MDIFNGNRKLEEVVVEALDWAVFLRHNQNGPIAPFMFLYQGDDKNIRVLMTDGDPVEYATKILKDEEKPYQQFLIAMEGYLRDEKDNRIDALIVQGFDKTQAQGVALAQMFEPMEKTGTFKKIDSITFLGNPEIPIEVVEIENPDYEVEEIGFNAVVVQFGDLKQYITFFTHSNPSVIANAIKRFLRAQLSGSDAHSLSGRFELMITPGMIANSDYLKYLVTTAITEEKQMPTSKHWENATGRKILINIIHGDLHYLTEFVSENKRDYGPEAVVETGGEIEELPLKVEVDLQIPQVGLAAMSPAELDGEFERLISMPEARTNVEALSGMMMLMSEYEKRGLPMPGATDQPQKNAESKKAVSESKPWWKFW